MKALAISKVYLINRLFSKSDKILASEKIGLPEKNYYLFKSENLVNRKIGDTDFIRTLIQKL